MHRQGWYVLALAFAFGLHVAPAVGETVAQTEAVRLSPVPARAVELGRDRTAATWNSQFCTRWTDECVSCTRYNALSRQAQCGPVKEAGATCTRSAVRCLDFDQVIAPLACVEMRDSCGSSLLAAQHGDEFFPLSNFECSGRKQPRPPVDWRCVTPQTVRDHCAKDHTGYQSRQECVREGLETWRKYRRAVERFIRDSNGPEVR
jgi:hypothetical protein